MTRTLLLLALLHLLAGIDLWLVLPRLGLGYAGTLAGVTLTGALWLGGAGCAVMVLAAGMVETWQRLRTR